MTRTLNMLSLTLILTLAMLVGCEEAPAPAPEATNNATPATPAEPVTPDAPAAELAPALTFEHVFSGGPRTFDELRDSGKVIVLDFFMVWCGPCIDSFPELRDLQTEYGTQMQVLGVTTPQGMMINHGQPREMDLSLERETELMDVFIAHNQLTWPTVFVPDSDLNAYGINRFPTVVVLDTDGSIAFKGHPHYLADELKKLLDD